jgi:hypothetical protein
MDRSSSEGSPGNRCDRRMALARLTDLADPIAQHLARRQHPMYIGALYCVILAVASMREFGRSAMPRLTWRVDRTFSANMLPGTMATPLRCAHRVHTIRRKPAPIPASPPAIRSAKYPEPGAIVELAGAPEVDQIRIDVKDTGIGIGPALLPHVFEMFSQMHGSRDCTESGLGMASHS